MPELKNSIKSSPECRTELDAKFNKIIKKITTLKQGFKGVYSVLLSISWFVFHEWIQNIGLFDSSINIYILNKVYH